jgi:hypothetical protein
LTTLSLISHRLLLHFFFAAVTALLDNVSHNPASVEASSDLQIVEPFLLLLEILAEQGESGEKTKMPQFCKDLEREGIPDEVENMLQICRDLSRNAREAVEKVSLRLSYDCSME